MVYTDKKGQKRMSVRVGKKVKTIYYKDEKPNEIQEKPIIAKTDYQLDIIEEDIDDAFSLLKEELKNKSNNKDLAIIIKKITQLQIENSIEALNANPEFQENKEAIAYITLYKNSLINYKNSLNKDQPIEDINQAIEKLDQLKEKWNKIKSHEVSVFKDDIKIIEKE